MPKQELSIEVTEVNCIEVDDVDFTKAGQEKIFEEFASNTTSSYQQ